MSLVAIVNLAERLLQHSSEQEQNAASSPKPVKSRSVESDDHSVEDEFTPSASEGPLAAQDPRLFRVSGFALFSAAANFLLSQRPETTLPPEPPAITTSPVDETVQEISTVHPANPASAKATHAERPGTSPRSRAASA